MTSREKLHVLVDQLTDAEADAALARLIRERELLVRWIASEDSDAAEDAWALTNARAKRSAKSVGNPRPGHLTGTRTGGPP
jgi:hypothetical protein